MSLYALKPQFQSLLRPAVRVLHRAGITANQVTVAAAIVSVALGIGLAFNARYPQLFLLIPLWLGARMAFNAIDGMLAREHGQASALGAYLNELADVVSDAALYLPFAFLPGVGGLAIGAIVFLAALTELAGVLGIAVGASRRYDGPMGKSDRALVFGALGLAVGIGFAPGAWVTAVLAVMIALLALTVVNRVRRGVAQAGGRRVR